MLNLHQSAEKAANQLTQSSTAEVIPFTARVTIKEVEVYSSIRAALPESESLVPNRANIAKHLYTLFAPAFVQPYPEAWIEIAYSDPVTGSVNAAETFSVFQLREAAEFAEKKNRAGSNIYVGPALRQGDRPPGGRAKDEHALTSSYAWAEYDGAGDDERIAAILDEQSFKPALVVTTGTVPHVRRHLYFELDGSVTPEQLKAINTSLMELLGSDAESRFRLSEQ